MDHSKIRKVDQLSSKHPHFLLPYQGKVFFFVLFIFFLSIIFQYTLNKLIKVSPMKFHSTTNQELESCTSTLCETFEQVSQNSTNVIYVANTIIGHNLRSYFYLVLDKNYFYIFTPLFSVVDLGSFLGRTVYSDGSVFITELLLPHGIFEMSGLILFVSLYYAVLGNILIYFKNKIPLWYYGKRILIQIGIVILLDIIAGFFEALAFTAKYN